MSSLSCLRCGAGNSEFDARCTACGAELPADSAVGLTRRGSSRSEPDERSGNRPDSLAHADAPPSIPGYRILGRLGSGGMGTVFRAQRLESGQAVAIKTLLRPRGEALPMIRREIHALSRMRHPGIVRILDTGAIDGVPWYAMELIEGVTLREFCARGDRTSQRQARLSIARRLCAPLAFLHGEGIVHGDLKPENIVLPKGRGATRSVPMRRGAPAPGEAPVLDAFADPVLVDFGLASESSGALGREALGGDLGIAGTPKYMAPEQIRGELLDARADLYSLGCILYELVADRAPFLGAGPREVVWQHLQAQPPAPSNFTDGIPAELDELILRLLAKSPRDRLGYATDVASVLAKLGAEEDRFPEGPAPRDYLYRPGWVGRDHLLQGVETRVAAIRPGGKAALILIGGESGVGKTRFILELARRATARRIQVLTGECAPQVEGTERVTPAGGPLHALSGPLQLIADRCRTEGAVETDRLLGPRAQILAPYAPGLEGLPGQERHPRPTNLPVQEARQRLYEALSTTLTLLAAEAPVLLILDDLQWSDELTLGWLQSIADVGLKNSGYSAGSVVIVGTYRSEELGQPGRESIRRLVQSRDVERFELGRLDADSVGVVVQNMLALGHPPESFVEALARQSEGNPFFVAEYLRAAVGERMLARDATGRWRVPGRAARSADAALDQSPAHPAAAPETSLRFELLPLPSSLRELVGRRLRDLPSSARRLVDAASVLGREVPSRLAEIVAAVGQEEFDEAIVELRLRHVLESPNPGHIRFFHDKVREVAYEQIPHGLRTALHRAAAEAVESYGAAGPESPDAALGHHWEQAGEPIKAASRYLAAAQEARLRYAHESAERHYRACIRMSDAATVHSVTARIELGYWIYKLQGRESEALSELEQALSEARQLGSPDLEGKSLLALGGAHWNFGHVEPAASLIHQSLSFFQRTGNLREEAIALGNLATLHFDRGRVHEANELFEAALVVHRKLEDRRAEALTLRNLGSVQKFFGQLENARAFYEQALEAGKDLGDGLLEGSVLGNLAGIQIENGAFDDAERLLERALTIHRNTQNRASEVNALLNLGQMLRRRGRLEEGRARLDEALAIATEVGTERNRGFVLAELARIQVDEGWPDDARHRFHDALSSYRQLQNKPYEVDVLVALAGLERRCGDFAEAEALLDRAGDLLSEHADPMNLGSYLSERGRLELARGRPLEDWLKRLAELRAQSNIQATSELGQNLLAFERAVTAARSQHDCLFRGELLDDLPAGWRSWLSESGQI